ncbi:hypothetical protein QUF88_26055 [Bacillus sp. DX1.1]|uniref:hypothetical protein n=1 Tax=unclassified Bacillus (in: firmicutes) TaxID=185979 RepID=UPI0025703CC7|nr:MULTISPECIES: hypothetical protein [unclassified Bacillus (in: firmicutes)]MDM5157152.1 hypothetical protein [Bacillus sp. DX1.1]WJE81385.1 hypothetical protein QRE67_23595 [Bacillus sp. DX3.1]
MDKKSIFSYISIKLAAASFLCFSFLCILFLNDAFDLYRLSDLLSESLYNPWIYGLFAYAISCSIIIDLLGYKLNARTIKTKLLLYIGFGYLCFVPFWIFSNEHPILFLIAGSIGAICSVYYYFGTYLGQKFKWFRYMVPILLAILFITITNIDFTKKEQWVEHTTANEFEATFLYFHGEHKIPIHVKQGDIVEFSITFLVGGNNGYGYSFQTSSEFNRIEDHIEISENTYQLLAYRTGAYYITVTGENLTGKIKANWKIK